MPSARGRRTGRYAGGWPCCRREGAGSPAVSRRKQCRPRLFWAAPQAGCCMVLVCFGHTRLSSCVRTHGGSCMKSHPARQERRWLETDTHPLCWWATQQQTHARSEREQATAWRTCNSKRTSDQRLWTACVGAQLGFARARGTNALHLGGNTQVRRVARRGHH